MDHASFMESSMRVPQSLQTHVFRIWSRFVFSGSIHITADENFSLTAFQGLQSVKTFFPSRVLIGFFSLLFCLPCILAGKYSSIEHFHDVVICVRYPAYNSDIRSSKSHFMKGTRPYFPLQPRFWFASRCIGSKRRKARRPHHDKGQ